MIGQIQRYDRTRQHESESDGHPAARRSRFAARLAGTKLYAPFGFMHRGHFDRFRTVWRGDGLVAGAAAGPLRGDKIPAHYPAHDVGKRSAERHARAAIRVEYLPA